MEKKTYDVFGFIYDLRRTKSNIMTLESIFANKKVGKKYELLPSAHPSITATIEEPFFINTQIFDIKREQNPKMLIFSAPGATGKSTLAKYLAYKYNGIYWNLANIQIGDNTFHGTLHRAFGIESIAEFSNDLNNGNSTLIIDAIDEAEMISGRKNIENFLIDINEFISNSQYPSIILLSRSETANFVGEFLRTHNVPICYYEIGFFADSQADTFVKKSLERNGKSINPAINECVKQYFNKIKNVINNDNSIENFLGYAPVLEAISKHICEFTNVSKLLNELTDDKKTNIGLVETIVTNLLDREQEKVKEAFKQRCVSDFPEISNDDIDKFEIYSRKEQMVRLCEYVCSNNINIDDYKINLPLYTKKAYADCIRTFIPQHPFLHSQTNSDNSGRIDFASPAFRDYIMANILLDKDYDAYVDMYYLENTGSKIFPSQLFWEYYIKSSPKNIYSNHLPFLYEAFKAKTTANSIAYIGITTDENGNTYGDFGINKNNNNTAVYSYDSLITVVDNKLIFDNLNGVSIDVPYDVEIGYIHKEIRIANTSISCRNLRLNANSASIEAYTSSSVTLNISNEIIKNSRSNLNFDIRGNSNNIKISAKNINNYYQLIDYCFNFDNVDITDKTTFIYHLGRIFDIFRTHKKDMPSKAVDYVDNVILSNNYRKHIFDFLFSQNVIFKDMHLYKINMPEMSAKGISWGALMTANEKQLENVHREFNDWIKNNNISI